MNVEYNKERNFFHLTSDEGKVITDYKEDNGIMTYHSSKSMYCPATANLERYYEITDEQDAVYKAEVEKAINEMLKERGLEK